MNTSNGSSLSFSVQTMQTNIGGALKAIHPDKEGVYRGVPLAVIGKPSRNNILYEPTSFIESIVNKKTRFYKSLIGGGLEGEWGHPMNIGLSDKDAIARTMQIDSSKVSHYFIRIYAKDSRDKQYSVIYGDVVPFGPCGQYLETSFSDPKRNAAFSLRSLTTSPVQMPSGYLQKKILALITFDAVSTPGFEEASKCFMDTGNESLNLFSKEEDERIVSAESLCAVPSCAEVIGYEAITNQSLLDMLEADVVTIKTHTNIVVGKFDKNVGGIFTSNKKISSVFHTAF